MLLRFHGYSYFLTLKDTISRQISCPSGSEHLSFPCSLVFGPFYPCGQQHKSMNQSPPPRSALVIITTVTIIIMKSNKSRSHSHNMYHGSSALGIYNYSSNDGYDSICLNHEPFQISTCRTFPQLLQKLQEFSVRDSLLSSRTVAIFLFPKE